MKKNIFIITLILSTYGLFAQQLNTSDLHIVDRYMMNPAVAGSNGSTNFGLFYTQYRSGMEDAKDVNLSIHMPVFRRVGLGLKVFSLDQGTYLNNTGIEFDYSYQLPLSIKGDKIGFGLGAMVFQQKFVNDFSPQDQGDPVIESLNEGVVYADATFGLSIYRQDRYFVDLSSYYLIENKATTSTVYTGNKLVRHYFANAGYTFDIGDKNDPILKIEPSVLFKAVGLIDQYQVEGGLTFYLKEYLKAGAFYRNNGDIVIIAGFGKKEFSVNFGYGLSGTGLDDYTNGRYSVSLIYKFENKKSSIGESPC